MPESLTPQKIVDIVRKSIAVCVDVTPNSLDQKLANDLRIDSLGVVDIALEAERRLNKATLTPQEIDIQPGEIGQVTVRDVVRRAAESYLGSYNPTDYRDSMLVVALKK